MLGLIPIGGCGESRETGQRRFSTADSAGIVTVRNQLDDLTAARPATERLRIGVATGDPAYELHGIFDSAKLSDGGIALVTQAGEVRVYSPEGVHRFAFGRRGGGPGEFRTPLEIAAIRGDTLVVGDEAPWRFSSGPSARGSSSTGT